MDSRYDRTTEDLGNIVALDHVNTTVPDQRLATLFYVTALGFTRDPFMSTGVSSMHINVGKNQFHLPNGEPQVVRGHVGIVTPERASLLDRLISAEASLGGTDFCFEESEDFVEVTSPWGNRLRCFEPESSFGPIGLGIPYVEFEVPRESAAAIGRFYAEVLGSRVVASDDASVVHCSVGNHQEFVFREVDRSLPAYDGHHVQIYVSDFSVPHEKLIERGLVFEESSPWQYRFKDIVDLDSGDVVYMLEHEVRSMTHPLFGRPLVNRDPNVRISADYVVGQEQLNLSLSRA